MAKRAPVSGTRRKPFGILAFALLLVMALFICLPAIFHENKFHVDNTLLHYAAAPGEAGVTGIEEIRNENPLFGDGHFVIRFTITPAGAKKLLALHDWKATGEGPLELLADPEGAQAYAYTSKGGHHVRLVLNAGHTQGVLAMNDL